MNKNLEIIYEPNIEYNENIKEQEKIFYNKLKKCEEKDIKYRNTTIGPHKDDIGFLVNNINMRSFGSQGQQRTTALSLKLAELSLIKEEIGEEAILLLDDVMSELDIERQKFLIKSLKDNQIFITSTEIDEKVINSFQNYKIINVISGIIE